MARKRMFDLEVVDTDLFLEMPQSTQNLYFHLGMRADDDGFVSNPKKIIRTIGANEDDLKVLFSKQFVIPFESGIVVIRHWKLNNYLRKDRYTETIYKEEMKQLTEDENGVYNLNMKIGIPNDNQNVTNGLHSIEKNSKEEISIDKNSIDIYSQNEVEISKDWEIKFEEFYSKYPKKVKRQDVKKWFQKNKPSNELFSSMLNSLEQFRASKDWQKDGGQFIPYPSTWLNQKRWEDEYHEETEKEKIARQVKELKEAQKSEDRGIC